MMVTRLMKADTVQFRLSDTAARRATSNVLPPRKHQLQPAFITKAKKTRAFKNLAPSALPIPYKKHKDAGMD